MSRVSDDSGSMTETESRGTPGRQTLLSVLPLTTAWAGATAVVAVPIAGVVVGSVVERSTSGLSFIPIMVPVLVGAAATTFVFGLAAGALAGLPDWFLRRRPLGTVGAVAAVVILTLVVAGASGAAFLVVPYLIPWPVLTQVCVVAAATAIATLVVISLHRRRERQRHQ